MKRKTILRQGVQAFLLERYCSSALTICLAVALLLCCSAVLSFAATVQLPQSGQKQCYDTTTNLATDCANTVGQDGNKKMGATWPNPRFSVSGDCVTDELTGLIWSKNANIGGARTWTTALDWVAALNSGAGLCGQTDWRLPNINELRSLVHSGYNEETCGGVPCQYMSTWLNSKGFSNVQSNYYWSSTTGADYTSKAWYVYMDSGYVYYSNESNNYYAWPVRGGQ
ncbi:MAG: DUF1566 domain-containing protein [Nitrospirae bacterium]|nr:DUF1566 domain-containing protein [Nitrospirota bacterium]